MAELLSMNRHRAPRMDRWAIHGTVHSVTDCQYCTNSAGCFKCQQLYTYVCVYVLVCDYVQLVRSVKWNACCSHASLLRYQFSASILRDRKLLNTEGGNLKIWRGPLKSYESTWWWWWWWWWYTLQLYITTKEQNSCLHSYVFDYSILFVTFVWTAK